jgi:hypothetical protein
MSGRNKCELCNGLIIGKKSKYKQTKYCDACAKAKKKENSLDPWPSEKKRRYMRSYMRKYRRSHPGLSSPYVRKHRQKKQQESATISSKERPVSRLQPSVDHDATYLLSLLWFLPLLWAAGVPTEKYLDSSFELIKTAITYLELLVVKITGLGVIVVVCLRHLAHLWKDKEK